MFLQASVCPPGGVCLSACWDTIPQSRHPPEQTPPPPGADPPGADTPREQTPPQEQTPQSRHPSRRDGHCCGRYASYWNAFLFISCFLLRVCPLCTQRNCSSSNTAQRKCSSPTTTAWSPVSTCPVFPNQSLQLSLVNINLLLMVLHPFWRSLQN